MFLCWQNPRNDRVFKETPTPARSALEVHRDIDIVGKLICHDDRLGAIRVESRHAFDARSISIGITPISIQNRRTRRHELAELRHHVVIDLKCVRESRGVDNDEPTASRATTRAEVWAVRSVRTKIPRDGARSPILQRAHGEICGLTPGGAGRGPALGHIL